MSKLRTDELENLSGSVTILVANLLQSSDLTAINTTYDNTSSGLTAIDVQDAIDEVDGNLDTLESNFNSHTGSGGSAHAIATTLVEGFMSTSDKTKLDGIETNAKDDQNAAEVSYDNTASGLTASDVQAAIDEVDSNVDSTDSSLSSHTGDLTIHRSINDAGTATTDLWSADKIGTELSGKLDTTAQAADSDLLDGQEGTYYLDRANHTGTQDLSTISDSGTAAAADLTTSATDTTAGRATKVGDYGAGKLLDLRTSTPASNGPPSDWAGRGTVHGFANGGTDAGTGGLQIPGLPISFAWGSLTINAQWDSLGDQNSAYAVNRVFTRDNRQWFSHAIDASTWSGWVEMYSRANILGTVSQSSGVPTGAIFEQGSNSNGAYTKFADGTMICSIDALTVGTFNSAYYIEGTWTFPAAFGSAPEGVLFNIGVSAGNASAVRKVAGLSNAAQTTTDTGIRIASVIGNDWVSGDSITGVSGIAVGRWF